MKVEKQTGRVLEGPMVDTYVYEAPVRLWHWVTVVLMVPLLVTGFLIANPPPSVGGEATFIYNFAWIRIIHFVCGFLFTIAFIGRIYWAIVGNHHARAIFLPPVWSIVWWKGLFNQASHYVFLKKEGDSWVGHNPLAQLAMCFMFVLGAIVIIVTGFALFAQQWGWGQGWMTAFGWVHTLLGEPQAVRTVHYLAMWYLVIFSMAHIYMTFLEDITAKETVISTMINGIRMFKKKEH